MAASPANAAWHESRSRHFTIYGDASPKWLRSYAMKLEKFDTAVRTLRDMDDPPPGAAGRVTIYLLPSTDAVSRLAVGKSSSIAGFYVPRASESLAFVPRRSNEEDYNLSAEDTLFHEYAHHLMFQATDDALPSWLIEGFAEFYTTVDFRKEGSVKLGMPADHRAIGLYRLKKPSMEKLLGLWADTNSLEMESLYGWSWVLTHYLTFAEDRRGQLANYIAALRSGKDSLAAAREAFGDLKKLDRDSDLYLHRNVFKYLTVTRPPPADSSIEVRPLRPGEAAIMADQIKSRRGVSAETVPAIAESLRRPGATYPNDPAVMRALAEAEFDVENYAAAEAAARKAIAALDRGKVDEALAAFRSSSSSDDDED